MWEHERLFFDYELKHASPPSGFYRIILLLDEAVHDVLGAAGKIVSISAWPNFFHGVLREIKPPSRNGPAYLETLNIGFFQETVLTLDPSPSDAKRGYKRYVRGKNGVNSFLTSESLNSALTTKLDWDPRLRIEDSSKNYQYILARISSVQETLRHLIGSKIRRAALDPEARPLLNERKIAIASDIDAQNDEISVFQSCYFASMLTTDLSSKSVTQRFSNRERIVLYADKNYPLYQDGGKIFLPSLSESAQLISNQIGINTILLTKDNYLVFPRQNLTANMHAGDVMPSASGSMDWDDLATLDTPTFRELCKNSALREIREELGRNYTKIRQSGELGLSDFFLTGLYRGLVRGCKPDVAAFGVLNWRRTDLREQLNEIQTLENSPVTSENQDESGTTFWLEVLNAEDMKDKLRDFVKAAPEGRSISLDATLHCVLRALEKHPEVFDQAFRKTLKFLRS